MNELAIKSIELNPDDANVQRVENRPFIVNGVSNYNSTGVLLVHGFTGSPWEMRDIGLHMAQHNACSLGIRLPGHGTYADDLAVRSYEEWLAAVEEGYQHLADKYDQVVGVGLSTGSLLLLAAAEKLPFAGLALLSPYLKMRQHLAPFAGFLQHFMKFNRRAVDSGVSPYYYQDRPLAGVHQINRLIRRVRKCLGKIKVPALIASAAGDITVNSKSAITLYDRLGSNKKEYYRFGHEVPHVLTTADNPRQDEVLRLTADFTGAIIAD